MYCKNCGKEIEENSVFCEFCGQKIEGENPEKKEDTQNAIGGTKKEKVRILKKYRGFIQKQSKNVRITIIVVLIALSIASLSFGITKISNEEYKYNKEQYEYCEDNRKDTLMEAGSSVYFSSTYGYLSESWEEMRDGYSEKLSKARTVAAVSFVLTAIFGYLSYETITVKPLDVTVKKKEN